MPSFLFKRGLVTEACSLSIFGCTLLSGCGSDPELSVNKFNYSDVGTGQYQSAVVNGTISSDDCYDVALLSLNSGSTMQSICSSFRVSEGVFMTAAHCVMPTRPQTNPLPNKWLTSQLTFTFNPNLNGRNFVDQIISLQVMVPPTASNYTNAQWGASTYTDSGLIAADMAVVITSDTQGPWDRSSDPKFITPAVNSTGYVVGYGIGAQDSNFNGSDAGRRRFGALRAGL